MQLSSRPWKIVWTIAGIAGVLLGARAVGLIQPVESGSRLGAAATDDARNCVEGQGFHFPEGGVELEELQRDERRFAAYDGCWGAVAASPRFARLKLVSPSENIRRLRVQQFALWQCVEQRYERTTPIPLNAPRGYPLAIRAGHFKVGATESDLRSFYEHAAECGKVPVDAFADSRGRLSRETADGNACIRHRHTGGPQHAHGCYTAEGYPR